MGRLLDEDDVVDWLLKRTEMYDATGHFVDENVVKKNIESQIAKISSAQPEPCEDAVSREALLELSEWFGERATYDNPMPDGVEAVPVDAIEKLPSVHPKPRTGEWILIDNHDGWSDWKCSQCGGSGRGDYHYCPWCNADMRGEQNEH